MVHQRSEIINDDTQHYETCQFEKKMAQFIIDVN